MVSHRFAKHLTLLLLFAAPLAVIAQQPVPTPPLGWNSWDSFGLSITAAEWKANVDWFHQHLQPAGWQYVVLDEGWYLAHPENANTKGADQGYTFNGYGQFTAAPNRFPQGIAALAADAHALGLRFGIHIIHGIPKSAVERNLLIAGTTMHAAEAADTTDTCRWNPDNYGTRDNAAGQAYYDELLKLYAGWGIDFLKVDCIASPYNTHEANSSMTTTPSSETPTHQNKPVATTAPTSPSSTSARLHKPFTTHGSSSLYPPAHTPYTTFGPTEPPTAPTFPSTFQNTDPPSSGSTPTDRTSTHSRLAIHSHQLRTLGCKLNPRTRSSAG